jgi:hypothetical protein
MSFVDDLSVFYADFGEPVTVAGSPLTAIYSSGFIESLGVTSTAPTLRVRASDVVGVARGAPVVRAGVNYTVQETGLMPETRDRD